jgi:hypothetical protein
MRGEIGPFAQGLLLKQTLSRDYVVMLADSALDPRAVLETPAPSNAPF